MKPLEGTTSDGTCKYVARMLPAIGMVEFRWEVCGDTTDVVWIPKDEFVAWVTDAVELACDDVSDVVGFHNIDEYSWAAFFDALLKRLEADA